MREFHVIPEFHHNKLLPIFAAVFQFGCIGFLLLGCCVTALGFLLAAIFQLCAGYFGILSLCDRFYRLQFSSDSTTVRNLFNKPKSYRTDSLRWRIIRIPWYNSYYVLLYSSKRTPIAVLKPHWKNALKLLKLPHWGKLSSTETAYLKFLKRANML